MIRDIKFDNLKGLAILLVVLGHFIGSCFSFLTFDMVDTAIYLFHMPLFIFISGYFSKITSDSNIKALKNIFIPFLLFDTLWIVSAFLIDGNLSRNMYIIPGYGLWYLLSLFFWRTFLPAADRIKYVFWFSILLALFIGTIAFKENLLSISRTLCFFPVFLFGYYFKDLKEKFTFNKYLSAGVFVTLIVSATLFLSPKTIELLMLRTSYSQMHMGNLEGIILRLLIIFLGIACCVLLFNIMTSKQTFLTKMGRNSLAIYILHLYFVTYLPELIRYLGFSFVFKSYIFSILYVALGTIFVLYILSRDVVTHGVNTLTEIIVKTLIKDESQKNNIYLIPSAGNIRGFLVKLLSLNSIYKR
jgi:fucose 4-O-acetylase-like acetyltransferase